MFSIKNPTGILPGKVAEKNYFGALKAKNMSVQVERYIADFLYEHDRVTVPGLGVFSLSYKPSQTDPVQEMLTPPTKTVSFRRSLDGGEESGLAAYIGKAEDLNEEQSRQVVQEYVQHAQEKLQRKELVIIDKVGRLYVDFEGALQFLPDTTNFDASTYGLPPISAQPLPTPPEPSQARPVATDTRAQKTKTWGNFVQRHLGAVIAVALILVVVIILALSYQRFFGEETENPGASVPEDRHNVAPPPADSGRPGDAPALDFPLDGQDNDDQASANADHEDYDDSETEAITPAPNQKEAVIAIGIFQNKENVNKLVERIYQAGYEPYLEKDGTRTRVGLQLSYQEFREVQKALRLARREFASDAFIMER